MTQKTGTVSGIVLAAGGSSRLGAPKQLLFWQGKPLVRIVSEKLLNAGIFPVIVVIGAAGKEVKKAITDLNVTTVENLYWKKGISTSIRAGIAALPSNTEAAIFSTSDQPFIPEELIRKLCEIYRHGDSDIVCPICNGQLRNPVIFDKSLFAELVQLEGDKGGKGLFGLHTVTKVERENDKEFRDIDTREDVQEIYGKSC